MRTIHALLFLCSSSFLSAQRVDILIQDQSSKEPIPYATVQFKKGKGVITNEEGYFSFNPSIVTVDSIKISCMGYVQRTLPVKAFSTTKATVYLQRNTIALNDVSVYASAPNIDAIMARVRRNIFINYKEQPIRQKIFHRVSSDVDFEELLGTIERSTLIDKQQLAEANAALEVFSKQFTSESIRHYTEFLAERSWSDSSKVKMTKATYLFDASKIIDADELQKKGQEIILKHLDSSKTYKVKTGLFKIEDSLKLDIEDLQEKEEDKDNWDVSYFRGTMNGVLKNFQFKSDSFLDKLINPKYYEYKLEDELASFNGKTLFVVRFQPRKRRAKYSGKLYINDEDYAIVRADYTYAEGRQGKKVNLKFLLGIRYHETLHRGTLFFQRDEKLKAYIPYYAKRETGKYVYVKRPFKFIENTAEKNKLKCEFLMELSISEKDEMMVLESNVLDIPAFRAFEEQDKFKVESLQRYDPKIWQEYQVLSPVDDMKTFGLDN